MSHREGRRMAIEGSVFNSCRFHRFSIGREASISAWGESLQAQQRQWGQALQAHAGLLSWEPTSSRPIAHLGTSSHVSKQTAQHKRGIKMVGIIFLHTIRSVHILSSLTPVLFITSQRFAGLSLRLFSSLNLTKIYLHTTLPLYSSIVSEFQHSSDVSCCVPTEHNPTLVHLSGGRAVCCGRGILDMVQAK